MAETKETPARGACPFCQSKKTKLTSKTAPLADFNGEFWKKSFRVYVSCNCCHARGPIASSKIAYPEDNSLKDGINLNELRDEAKREEKETEIAAILAWNRA